MSYEEKYHPGRSPDSLSMEDSPEEDNNHLEGLTRLAREIVYQTPEIRPEKVARLKEAIEQGAYEIDSERLADIIIEEVLGKR